MSTCGNCLQGTVCDEVSGTCPGGCQPNRTQSVIVGDHISQVSSLSYGVPQGTVLGPILFILYTKPLSQFLT